MALAKERKRNDQPISLLGPGGDFMPYAIPPEKRDTEALTLFQSFLCNSPQERAELSNVIMLWELVPRFAGDSLNSLEQSELPNAFQKEFVVSDKTFELTVFPGTYYPQKSDKGRSLRRFPGAREQAVEQALIRLASDQAEIEKIDGEVHYYVRFSIRDLARLLKGMGSTQSHGQIREALEVLSSAIMTLSIKGEVTDTERTPILPKFRRRHNDAMSAGGTDMWLVQLHPIVSHAIRNAIYRQFPVSHTKGFKPFSAYLIRQMYFMAPNISPAHPFTFSLAALRETTPGLNHQRVSGSLKALEKELDKMLESGLLKDYHVEKIFPARRPRGKPTPIDATITLYPGDDWIRHVMKGSKRLTVTEQSLGLPRSERANRQMTLPML